MADGSHWYEYVVLIIVGSGLILLYFLDSFREKFWKQPADPVLASVWPIRNEIQLCTYHRIITLKDANDKVNDDQNGPFWRKNQKICYAAGAALRDRVCLYSI